MVRRVVTGCPNAKLLLKKQMKTKFGGGGIPASVLRSIRPLVGRSLRPVTVSTDASGSNLARIRKVWFLLD